MADPRPLVCPVCEADDVAIGEARNVRDQAIFPWYCKVCNEVLTQYASKAKAEAYRKQFGQLRRVLTRTEHRIERGEPVSTDRFVACEVCGSVGDTELHHWAPYHLFGIDADKWPTAHLCRSCHVQWHKAVTPKMGENSKA